MLIKTSVCGGPQRSIEGRWGSSLLLSPALFRSTFVLVTIVTEVVGLVSRPIRDS